MTPRARWLVVLAFAVAMAWMEAATVYYLRVLVDRVEPYQPNPLPMAGVLGAVELVREAATLVMLLTVGTLAGRSWWPRLGYTAIAFGVWDIFYYVFLRIICGWPKSLLDWDVLFLLPLPWWGPVLAPVLIAVLMIVWGTVVTQLQERPSAVGPLLLPYGMGGLGIGLALYLFMADSLRALQQGLDVTQVLPTSFNWAGFCVALALMAAPTAQALRLAIRGQAGHSAAAGSSA